MSIVTFGYGPSGSGGSGEIIYRVIDVEAKIKVAKTEAVKVLASKTDIVEIKVDKKVAKIKVKDC